MATNLLQCEYWIVILDCRPTNKQLRKWQKALVNSVGFAFCQIYLSRFKKFHSFFFVLLIHNLCASSIFRLHRVIYRFHLCRLCDPFIAVIRQTFQFPHIFAFSVSVDNREKTFCFSLTVPRMLSAFAGSAPSNIAAPSVVQFKFRCKCAVNKHQQNYIHSAPHEAKVIIKIYIRVRTRSMSSHIPL